VRKYEFVFILDPGVDDAGVADSLERYSGVIRDQGGEVVRFELWGRRRFTYEIKHKTEGSYVYVKFRGDTKVVDELNRVLRFDERVLRTLIVLDEDAVARNEAALRRAGKLPAAMDESAAAGADATPAAPRGAGV
jgi:small subunit ribosomal protein S6